MKDPIDRAPMGTALAALAIVLSAVPALAQPIQSMASSWMAKADLAQPFAVPSTLNDWNLQRQSVRQELWALLGQMPPRPKTPKIETVSREDRGDFIVEKFRFDNGAGAIVPGYLVLPKHVTGRIPGILYCHWHAGEYDLGKEELFQAKHTPEAPGPAFAARGYAVVAIDATGFGERNGQGPDGPAEKDYTAEETASKFDLWVGRTFWGMLLRDDLMALDYLVSRPEVDPDRIGATGMSMGATRTWWLMALDERIKVGAATACLTRYENMIEHGQIFQHDIGYFVPNMLKHFDSEAVVALIAPRAILFQTGDRDNGSPVDGIHAIESAVRPAYRLYGSENSFQSIVYPGLAHVYTPEMWKRTLDWFDTHLRTPAGGR
jgi:dienelactone hydrolase